MATLGQQLVEPEEGWVRHTDLHKVVRFTGTWQTASTGMSTSTKGDSLEFNVKGGDVRIMGRYWGANAYTSKVSVYVDDTLHGTFTQAKEEYVENVLQYEIKGLVEGVHSIRIVNEVEGKYLFINALDVPLSAPLLPLSLIHI